jgi:hypothetical protein
MAKFVGKGESLPSFCLFIVDPNDWAGLEVNHEAIYIFKIPWLNNNATASYKFLDWDRWLFDRSGQQEGFGCVPG